MDTGSTWVAARKEPPPYPLETVAVIKEAAAVLTTSVSPDTPQESGALRICLVEPFFTGSHERWATEFAQKSRHRVDILSLPGRHWKWRMHGAAITLADNFRAKEITYDAILVSDMLDLNVFLSRLRSESSSTPVAVYFHENQLLYPWSPRDSDTKKGRDLHYAFINYSSALAADALYFNSDYHRISFIEALPEFLKRYPDFQNLNTVEEISQKSSTLWLGMDLTALDAHRTPNRGTRNDKPLVVWNHRWEYDKNPIGFFRILYKLQERGIEFDLALLGEGFEEEPPYFREAKDRLGKRIVHYGKASQFFDYARLLWQADIALVTSCQDFFGQSVVESVYCGCHPLLPERLAYPDHLDPSAWPHCYYRSESEALERVVQLIESGDWKRSFSGTETVKRYDWGHQIGQYDRQLERLANRSNA